MSVSGYGTLTGVGSFPADWPVVPVREFAHVKTGPFGTMLKASEYSDVEGVPLISVSEIGAGYFRISDRTPLVPGRVTRRLPQYLLKAGDIVFGRKGAVDRSVLVTHKESGWFLGSDGMAIRPKIQCDSRYLALWLQTTPARSWMLQNATGTTMASLNQAILGRLPVPLPSVYEQTAIAERLCDVDALAKSLDELIAKKHDLKQAAMRQLLTGRTRLPAFNDLWKSKKISQLAPLQRGFDLPTKNIKAGPYPVVYSNGVLARHSDWRVEGPGVVTGRSGTIGAINYVEGRYWPHNTTLWVTRFNGNDPRFVYYLYGLLGFDRFATGSGVPTLNRNDVHAHEVSVPPSLAEQEAIVAVLSDMDADIAAHEARREKTRAIKQAMMQELLTGRTRLVSPNAGATHA